MRYLFLVSTFFATLTLSPTTTADGYRPTDPVLNQAYQEVAAMTITCFYDATMPTCWIKSPQRGHILAAFIRQPNGTYAEITPPERKP